MSLRIHDLAIRRQIGFTLVEVLIAMVVLAFGLLGLASLQATSLRFNNSAYLRSQATNIAYDIVDRMRVNHANALAGDYDNQDFQDPPPACASDMLVGTIAQRDIQSWRSALTCTLPQGTGSVTRVDNQFTIVIRWDDSHGEDAPQSFTMVTEL